MNTSEDKNKDNPEPLGGGGLPFPKRTRKYGKLPFLNRRQTYRVIVAIPVIQLLLSFLLYLIAATDFYKISYPYIIQITGFSLLTGLYQWYMAKFSGSCIGAQISIYTLIALNIMNVLYLAINFNYFFYGTILTGIGLLLSVPFFRRSRQVAGKA